MLWLVTVAYESADRHVQYLVWGGTCTVVQWQTTSALLFYLTYSQSPTNNTHNYLSSTPKSQEQLHWAATKRQNGKGQHLL